MTFGPLGTTAPDSLRLVRQQPVRWDIVGNDVRAPRRRPKRPLRAASWVCLLSLTVISGCERDLPAPGENSTAVVSDAPETNELPPLELRDDTADLLLTWIDDKGDFHVVQKPGEVPPEGRGQVRVVITTKPEGGGRLVYVADLTQKAADGSYSVKTMTRAQWNELGADRRKVRMEALEKELPKELADKPASESPNKEPSAEEKALNAKVRAIVYGADWCKPCHDAEAFLKKLGVDVAKKDIEESRAARAEMQSKLASAGRMGASIPVIDVGGKLLVGFSRAAVQAAVEAARKPETL